MKAAELDLYCQRGADFFEPLVFAYYDEDDVLIEHDYDDHDFVFVVEDEFNGTDLITASVENGRITTGQTCSLILPGESSPTVFTHAIYIHLPASETNLTPKTYPVTLIRTVEGMIDKSILGRLTIESAGGADG